MESVVFVVLLISVSTLLSNIAENLRLKNYWVREYDADKRAVKRICASCRRKWSNDKNGSLRAKFDNIEDFISYEVGAYFEYTHFVNKRGYMCEDCYDDI